MGQEKPVNPQVKCRWRKDCRWDIKKAQGPKERTAGGVFQRCWVRKKEQKKANRKGRIKGSEGKGLSQRRRGNTKGDLGRQVQRGEKSQTSGRKTAPREREGNEREKN